jgi:hypothetical protein
MTLQHRHPPCEGAKRTGPPAPALEGAERTFASAEPKPGTRDLGVGGIENYLLCHVARREARATVRE